MQLRARVVDVDGGKITVYGVGRVAFFSPLCLGAFRHCCKNGLRSRIADAVEAETFNLLQSDYSIY